MKVTVIGGGGRVGSNAAYALQCGGIVSEIQLIDVNADLAEGEALDLMHGASVFGDQRIYAGDYDRARDTDIFVITAGSRRKPDESRLDLINRNVSIFKAILTDIQKAGYKNCAKFFVVSNPVDILTHIAATTLDVPQNQVLGLGTMLDTSRFRSLISAELNLPTSQVKALILGEHGDTMVPIWSSATVAGLPLKGVPKYSPNFENSIFTRTRGSGAEVIKRKGGAGWAVASTIAEAVHAIVLDSKSILPVSSAQNGCYGIRNISLSVPTVVGKNGVEQHIEFELWPKEKQALIKSAQTLSATFSKVQ